MNRGSSFHFTVLSKSLIISESVERGKEAKTPFDAPENKEAGKEYPVPVVPLDPLTQILGMIYASSFCTFKEKGE